MKIPKDCVINEFYTDSKHPLRERLKYCKKMCQYKCQKGIEYKKIK